jgi:diguanylate cyclase (GGDEF)-like protein/PAS domain S-box-containing protein
MRIGGIVSNRGIMGGYLLGALALVAGSYAFPAWHLLLASAIGLASAGAVLVGVRRYRPRHQLPWWLLVAANVAFLAADTAQDLVVTMFGRPAPFPFLTDALYLVTCVLQVAATALLVRMMTGGRDRASVRDSVIITFGATLLYWVFLIKPDAVATHPAPLAHVVLVAHPFSDILLLAVVTRLVGTAGRNLAAALLALGYAGLLAADVAQGLGTLGDVGHGDLGWIVYYTGWAAAALHPSMVRLTEPRPNGDVAGVRIAVLTLAAMVAPVVLLVEALRGPVRDGLLVAVFSTVIFALVLLRLAGEITRHRQVVLRERSLREAAGALLLADDVAAIGSAVRRAVADLLPAGTPHRVAFAERACPSGSGPRVLAVAELDPEMREQLADFPTALCLPLTLADRTAVPRVGGLVVAAAADTLARLRWPAEALAIQAALALERIALAGEVSRRTSEEYFRTLVQNNSDLIFILDDRNGIRYASPSATGLFGEAPVGSTVVDLLEPGDRLMAVQLLDLVRSGGHRADTVDWRLRLFDGAVISVEVSCRDLRDEPTVRGLVVTLRDVTERRRLERELTLQAFQDPLTGLANRVLFQERAGQAVARSHRSGRNTGALLIDLDDFKELNDSLGHASGDELLAAVGVRLADALGPEHTTARLGGDEFAALVEDVSGPEELDRIAESLLRLLAEPLPVGDHVVHVRASVGVALAVEANDGEDLIRQADLALYAAKGAGKGQWRRYESELHTAAVQRLMLRGELERAVERDEFAVYYQPIVELDSGTTVGFEALVRWEHPERGLLAPIHFIGAAEESGLIVPMGGFVLREAAAIAARWYRQALSGGAEARRDPRDQRRGPDGRDPRDQRRGPAPYVSVNVSARQFRSPGFVDAVREELTAQALPPHLLMLEITESLLLRDDERVWADLAELRDIGVRVAIDDFGTGYSSLSYLRQVPIDVLKIDKSFVETASSSPRQQALVEGIVRLADTLGLQVVAEGIEGAAERDLLVRAGCRHGQGYLFARPMSAGDTVTWLFPDRVAA